MWGVLIQRDGKWKKVGTFRTRVRAEDEAAKHQPPVFVEETHSSGYKELLKRSNPGRFRHEDVSAVPSGWKVRTIKHRDHRVRVAFPPGRKQTGSGRLVSILHPTGENPACTMRSSNPAELMIMGANPPRRRGNGLTIPDKHQIKIAKKTLKMPDAVVGVMGGMNKEQAREVLRRHGIRFSESNPPVKGLHIKYSPVNQAYFLMWHGTILRVFQTKQEAKAEMDYLLRTSGGAEAPENPGSVYSKAVSMGYPYARGDGRTAPDGKTWLSRFTKTTEGTGHALYIGWNQETKKWVIEHGNPAPNPRVEVVHSSNPPVEDIVEEFTGAPAEWLDVYNEPHMARGRYAQLGPLIALYIKPAGGGQVRRIGAPENRTADWESYWNGDPPIIVTDTSAKQIYFVGGAQDITEALEAFGARDRGNGLLELGECRRIDYEGRKEHVAAPDEDQWKHDHGEENGKLPTVLFDTNHKRLLYEGGDYRIDGPWIRN